MERKKKVRSRSTPVLFTNDSEEATSAVVELATAGLGFVPLASDGPAPILVDHDRIFHGIESIRRYIREKSNTTAH